MNKFLEIAGPYFGFVKNSLFQRWAIAVILCSVLALIMAPDLYLSEPKFQLGMVAPKNIKADYAFLVEDEIAAEQKKIEDAENIKPVYDFNGKIADYIKTKLLKALSLAAENYQPALKDQSTHHGDVNKLQKEKKRLESNLGIYLSAKEFYVLSEYKFSEELQKKLSNLIISFYEKKFITNDSLRHSEKQKGFIIRNLTTQISEEIKDSSYLLNINEIDSALLKSVDMIFHADESSLKDAVFSITKKLIEPNLTFNKEATEKKKLAVIGEESSTFFKVEKNEMIVREGEKIGYL
ncbi:MAG: hypothetical protein JW925_03055, partial [Syntrophaceae bacterium]|nr:hypothetical protein [Syntrophaceae bacterium]